MDDGFAKITGDQGLVAHFLHHPFGVLPNENLIFDDENYGHPNAIGAESDNSPPFAAPHINAAYHGFRLLEVPDYGHAQRSEPLDPSLEPALGHVLLVVKLPLPSVPVSMRRS